MSNKDKDLASIVAPRPSGPAQGELNLGIEKQKEINGVGMGVLSDGTAFLSGRGLARLCGIAHTGIQEISSEWLDANSKGRIANLKQILAKRGVYLQQPHIPIRQQGGTFYAYPDVVCIAVLEYYAFDAGSNVKADALRNYRLLAGAALKEFIYTQVGYDPSASVPDVWRQFHDRVSLNYDAVPQGFFGIFKEMADIIVTLGQAGAQIDSRFVPDISVGRCWSDHWKENDLDQTFSERKKFDHNYPSYFPQSLSNPQDSWCYPESALGEFRRWFREEYVGEGKFQNYIAGKVAKKELPVSFAQLALAAYSKKSGN